MILHQKQQHKQQ